MSARLDTLLSSSAALCSTAVWRGDVQARWQQRAVASGWDGVDARLPTRGWPLPALIEILYEHEGIGELRFLAPALARLSQSRPDGSASALAWVNPPHMPYAPALHAWGLDPARQLIAASLSPGQMLWTMEQALRSKACGAVLGWAGKIESRWLRRLKLAALEGDCLGIVFRPLCYRAQPSPATVRLALAADTRASGAMRIQFLKIQGGRPGTVQWR